jgi:hypothetical protein
MLLATGTPPDRLDGIAPLFGDAAATAAPAAPAAPALATTERPMGEPPVIPAPTDIKQEPPPAPVATPAPSDRVNLLPVDQPSPRRRRYELIGMASGAGMVVLGFVLWGAATSVQGDINDAPTTTKQNLLDLKDLEARGDAYAGLGNLFTIGGLVVGGISTYFFLKDHRAASVARLVPTVLDHGVGLVLTIGGTP